MGHDTAEETYQAGQRAFFHRADAARFRWQTQHPYVAEQERELLSPLREQPASSRVLEVGCGEGANLWHVRAQFGTLTAVDFSLPRVQACRSANPYAQCVAGDALRLPFADASFDVVFCRDLLHHIPRSLRAEAVAELHRVCAAGGLMALIESNGRNPLIFAHGALISAERGECSTSPAHLQGLFERLPVAELRLRMARPLPLFLLLLHPRYGLPELGHLPAARWLLHMCDRVAAAFLPPGRWAYCRITARKTLAATDG